MSHLEDLLHEYYDWQGYIVRRNIKVGRLVHGGWQSELDLVVYRPDDYEVLHLEPSLDADTWERREQRFSQKFEAGKEFIPTEVLPWLRDKWGEFTLRQVAVLVTGARAELAGGTVRSVDDFVGEIKDRVMQEGVVARRAISERYPLLRTIQVAMCGYYRLQAPVLASRRLSLSASLTP